MKSRLILNVVSFILIINTYGRTLFAGIPFINLMDDVLLLVLLSYMPLTSFPKRGELYKPLFILMAVLCLSAVLNSVEIDILIMQIRTLFLPLVVIPYIIKFRDAKIGLKVIRRIVLITIPIILIGLVEIGLGGLVFKSYDRFGNSLDSQNVFRAASTVGNPIDLGLYLLMIISVLIVDIKFSLGLIGKKFWSRILLFGAVIVLLGTKSRGPIIALGVALLYLLIIERISLKYYVLSAILALSSIFGFGSKFFERFSSLRLNISESDGYREIWLLKSIEILRDYLFLGVGPGMYGGWVSINYKESWVYSAYRVNTDGISSIDMFFVHLVCEIGIIGLLTYFIFFLSQFISFSDSHKQSMDVHSRAVSLMILMCIIFLFVTGFTCILLESQLILFTYGSLYASARIIRENQNNGKYSLHS